MSNDGTRVEACEWIDAWSASSSQSHAKWSRWRVLLATLLVVSTLGLAGPRRASASNVVCSAESLVAAIEGANASAADDILSLAHPGCTYWLATAHNFVSGANRLPVIADSAVGGTLTIHGNGAKIARVALRVATHVGQRRWGESADCLRQQTQFQPCQPEQHARLSHPDGGRRRQADP